MKNRITNGLPFAEQEHIQFKGQKTKWRIVAIFEEGNYIVLANGDTPKQVYIDKLLRKIENGEAEVIK